MDPRVYQALITGNIAALKTILRESQDHRNGTTAQKNTILHIAASLDYDWTIPEIIEIFNYRPQNQFALNSKGDTPLHCAARSGKTFVVNFLISSEKMSGGHLRLQEPKNERGNTPLHEAVRNCHLGVAFNLMKADEQLGQMVNDLGESAVYVAAKRGAVEIVGMLLQFPNCSVAGPNEQTALHAAVCRNYESVELLLQARPGLNHRVDETESSPLHYAVSTGNHKVTQLLLGYDAFTAHLADKDGFSPIHVAAAMGYTDIISEIIKHCPDAVELTSKKGRNFVHVAVENKKTEVVKYVLRIPFLKELINEADCEGNTPLHLATIGHNLEIVHLLLADKRVDSEAWNYKGFTAVDLASISHGSSIRLRMHKIIVKLVSAGSQFSPQRMDFMAKKSRQKNVEEINRCRALANNLALVAVLIATVTFAAAFTMPGGYENEGLHQGMAILGKKTAFKAFLISDAIAMVSSITVTCLLIYTGSVDHDIRLHSLSTAMKLMWVALGGMVVAFATGTYVVVVSNCEWVAIFICFMACSIPFIAWMIVSWPTFDSLKLVKVSWPTFDSLKLVKVSKNQGGKVRENASFKVLDLQKPHCMVGSFGTPHSSSTCE